MTAKPQPPNSELLKEIKAMSTRIDGMDARLSAVELYKQAQEMYEKALKKVYGEKQESNGAILNKELLKALGLALTAIVSLVALIQASK